ncbi:GGDEF domain-containing protein [Kineosporia sp. J2-2]|uniref:GGDEF domain-containing protein n=1 Tax=Kineosporia corallincola TaxID=2835133 RepID=A0ABS5TPD5_9ACTN|nr:GGDEF domain-containing protein [Kineosporia corallincola]MBT0772968.1 GGDEF domain-containing protein [Kineosporia corallincola]
MKLTTPNHQPWTTKTLAALTGLLLLALHRVRTRTLRAHIARARSLAHRDPLTGLGNRAALHEALVVPRRGRTVLGLLDLDGFKPVNDEHGHQAGDRVLQIVSARLQAATAGQGRVFRIGGDEFVVLWLDFVPPPGVWTYRVADLLLARVTSTPVQIAGHRIPVAASLGLIMDDGHLTAGQLLRRADLAMYEAKKFPGSKAVLHSAFRVSGCQGHRHACYPAGRIREALTGTAADSRVGDTRDSSGPDRRSGGRRARPTR